MKKHIASYMMPVFAQSFVPKLYSTSTTQASSISTSSLNNVNSSSRYQNGNQRKNGTLVTGYMKPKSNSTNLDQHSTRSNVNPHEGTTGSCAYDYSTKSYNYASGSAIHPGSRGCQYYINSNKNYIQKIVS